MVLVITRSSQAAARYTPAGGAERCSQCRFYNPQGTCGRIIGPVSPRGWCKYYSREMAQRYNPGSSPFAGGGPPASFTLDLMTPGTLDPGITFTRASVATYFDVAGAMQTATANTPRWDYDPVTHALRGLLIEEQRINLLLNSATLGTQSVTTTAVATTLSFYGTGTVTLSGVSTAGPLVGTGAFPQRVALTFTPTAGTLTLTVTGSVLNAQLEAGAFVTSWIPTTAASVTRVADSATMPTAAWLTSTTAWSFAVDAMIPAGGGVPTYAELDDGTNNNRSLVQSDSGLVNLRGFETNAGATIMNTIGAGSPTAGVPFKAALATASGIHQIGLNGTAAAINTNSTAPPIVNTLRIGKAVSPTSGSFYVRRFRYWSRALSSSELQQVTT